MKVLRRSHSRRAGVVSVRLLSVNRRAAERLQAAAAAAETADRSQAEYYLQLLYERCVQIDGKIAKYQTAMERYASRGRIDHVRRCRRLIRIEEHDRSRLERMIAALYRRFPPPGMRPSQGAMGTGWSLPTAATGRHPTLRTVGGFDQP